MSFLRWYNAINRMRKQKGKERQQLAKACSNS
jgi:hypothetical protein